MKCERGYDETCRCCRRREAREAAIRAAYIRAATGACSAAVEEAERWLKDAEDDGDMGRQVERSQAEVARRRALLSEATRLAGENFDLTLAAAEQQFCEDEKER